MNYSFWKDKNILVTGGTGSFGNAFTKHVLDNLDVNKLVIFSRDEFKQSEMAKKFKNDSRLRFFVGDVRDKDRLKKAFHGIDFVIHAAALKQVPACEYNPGEAVNTNILGTKNVLDMALEQNVSRTISLSTDKAVNPVNLYGATKLVGERLVIQSNSYVGKRDIKFACTRYGNVINSRGSVIPLFREQVVSGQLTVTHPDMTRFMMTIEKAVELVVNSIQSMHGGEIFVPKLGSRRVLDIAREIGGDCDITFTGIRPGEKIHEVLISSDEARHTVEYSDYYVVEPEFHFWSVAGHRQANAKNVSDDFEYSSKSCLKIV